MLFSGCPSYAVAPWVAHGKEQHGMPQTGAALPAAHQRAGQCCVFEFEAGEAGEAGPISSANNRNLAYLAPYLAQLRDEIMACLQRFPAIRGGLLRQRPERENGPIGPDSRSVSNLTLGTV